MCPHSAPTYLVVINAWYMEYFQAERPTALDTNQAGLSFGFGWQFQVGVGAVPAVCRSQAKTHRRKNKNKQAYHEPQSRDETRPVLRLKSVK